MVLVVLEVVLVVLGVVRVVLEANIEQNIEHRTMLSEPVSYTHLTLPTTPYV